MRVSNLDLLTFILVCNNLSVCLILKLKNELIRNYEY